SRFPDASDNTISDTINSDVLFAAGTPAAATSLTAAGRYQVSDSLIVGDQESTARGSFLLDPGTGELLDFRIQVCLGGSSCESASQIWRSELIPSLSLSGSSEYIAGTPISGDVRVPADNLNTSFQGFFQGLFVGNGSNDLGFATGLRWLEDGTRISGTREIIDSALLFTRSNEPVFGLSTSQLEGVTRNGVIWGGGLNQYVGAASDFASDDQIFVDTFNATTLPIAVTDDFGFLDLTDLTPETLETNVGGFDLQWGLWNASASDDLARRESYYGIGDFAVETITGNVFSMSVTETPFGSFSGQKEFSDVADFLIAAEGFDDNDIGSVTGSFTIELASGSVSNGQLDICVGASSCDSSSYGEIYWPVFFSGTFFGTGRPNSAFSSAETNDGTTVIQAESVGFILGEQAEGFVLSFSSSSGLGADQDEALDNAQNTSERFVNGAVLFTGEPGAPLQVAESSVDQHDIGWGAWDNPIDQNWVTVEAQANGTTTLATDDYLATVNPTPVANLQGTASYASSPASSFVGSGSGGVVTDLVAAMDVDFNSGAISNGSLQVEVAGSELWSVGFDGSVANGNVQLDATGGQLSQFGNQVSDSVSADLGGVFTGPAGEAFVGGFDLLNQTNPLNAVNGLFTIEK
ncbi:MAG: hypothetical protein ACE37D_12975, partial [Pseudomonadales bacterium]